MTDGPEALRTITTFGALRALFDDPDSMRGASLSLREGSFEMDYFAARSELERGVKLEHGFRHLAEIVAAAPSHPAVRALVDGYDRAAGLASLLPGPDEEPRYYATEALRALVWARAGRWSEALDLLLAVQDAKPSARYLDAWALDWARDALPALTPHLALSLLGAVLNGLPEHDEMTALRADAARRWAELALTFARNARLDASMAPVADMLVPGILSQGRALRRRARVRGGGVPRPPVLALSLGPRAPAAAPR